MDERSDYLRADEAAATLEVGPFRTDRDSPCVFYQPPASGSQASAEGDNEHAQSEGAGLQSKQNPSRERRNFLALREGAFGHAVDGCLSSIVTAEDGQHLGTFLLSQIDHWDYEKERVFMIMENVVLSVKYDFSKLQVISASRLPFYGITKLIKGEFVYPRMSFVRKREGMGLRVYFSDDDPSLLSQLNPWSDKIPYWTITSHILYEEYKVPDDRLKLETFMDKLLSAIHGAHSRLHGVEDLAEKLPQIEQQDIYMDTYTNMTAVVHNSQHLGYFKQNVTS